MQKDVLKDVVLKIIKEHTETDITNLSDNDHLSDLFDSFELLSFLSDVESQLNISLPNTIFHEENLQTINGLLNLLIEEKSNG